MLENKEQATAKIYRTLKPDGSFIASTVCLGDTMKSCKIIVSVGMFLSLMPRVKVFTMKALESSVTDAGFDIANQCQPVEKIVGQIGVHCGEEG